MKGSETGTSAQEHEEARERRVFAANARYDVKNDSTCVNKSSVYY